LLEIIRIFETFIVVGELVGFSVSKFLDLEDGLGLGSFVEGLWGVQVAAFFT
jgi:hypothetical protein